MKKIINRKASKKVTSYFRQQSKPTRKNISRTITSIDKPISTNNDTAQEGFYDECNGCLKNKERFSAAGHNSKEELLADAELIFELNKLMEYCA